jgi:DNA-binding CsgD family transcriptional regulator
MASTTRSLAARDAIARLTTAGLESRELLHEVAARMRRVIPHDLGILVTLDHETLLPNSRQPIMYSPGLCRGLVYNEAVTPDLNKFSDMSLRTRSVAALRDADDDAGQVSPRRHDILRPAGLDDEVRVVFRADGCTWGAGCFLREPGTRPFDAAERRFLEEISADMGRGLRLSLSRSTASASPGVEPGVVVLDQRLHEISATPAARHWRRLIPPEASIAINAVALRAQAGAPDDAARRTRVQLTTGEWLAVSAAQLTDGSGAPPLTAVTLSPLPPAELVPLLLRLHGLSSREHEVAELLHRGLSTDEIAAQLHISRHTLRDHVKSIFAKFGATSRSELMAILSGAEPRPT